MVAREENEPQDTSYPSVEGGRFHAVPDSMLATLCANKYPKSKNNSIKDPACAQPARQEAPKTLLGRSHPEEAGIYVFMDSLIAC